MIYFKSRSITYFVTRSRTSDIDAFNLESKCLEGGRSKGLKTDNDGALSSVRVSARVPNSQLHEEVKWLVNQVY